MVTSQSSEKPKTSRSSSGAGVDAGLADAQTPRARVPRVKQRFFARKAARTSADLGVGGRARFGAFPDAATVAAVDVITDGVHDTREEGWTIELL